MHPAYPTTLITRWWRHRLALAGLLLSVAIPSTASAQQALPDLPLEELMGIDSGRVFGASERIQPVTEAPASVSFITAEEIARYGYRTLAEILRGVRGMYVTDNRNFSLVGTRGFGNPGDNNSRILLLVNGHRVNDNVYGQAEVGAEFGIDPAMFERVEIIRGPASSLYGDSAFFAVVNVITKRGASLDGVGVALGAGSLGRGVGRISAGKRLTNGIDFAFSGTLEGSRGVDRLYFPVFDTPATNHGIAEGLDGEQIGQFYSQLSFKNLIFTGAYGSRRRDVPTASSQTLFNEQESREQTTDRHTLADAEYVHAITGGRVTFRGSYDRFSYDGVYPFAGEVGAGPTVAAQGVVGTRWTVATRLTRRLPGRQVLTAGIDYIDNIQQNQYAEYVTPDPALLFDLRRSSTQQAFYAQNEFKLKPWLILNGGLRYDRYQDFTRVTPRAAVIVMPSANQSFKYLYGNAFRAPNAYELNPYIFGEVVTKLSPETVDTHELVWERYANDWLRTSLSSYWYKADGLITLVRDADGLVGTSLINQGHVRATGLEIEAQMRLRGGVQGLVSYALQRAIDTDTQARLVNSPRQMAKLRISATGPVPRSLASIDLQYTGRRLTRSGVTLGAAVTANASVTVPVGRSLEVIGGIRNLFDESYADPVSESHRQDSVLQNGRTLRIDLRWQIWK